MASKKQPQMQKPKPKPALPDKKLPDLPPPKNLYVPKDPFGTGDPLHTKNALKNSLFTPPKPSDDNPRWIKQTLKMKDNHTWSAPDGYVIVVLDRGAVRFNMPEGWHTDWKDGHLQLYDAKPPKDTAGISVTLFHLPPNVNWEGLPLPTLLEQSTSEERDVETHGEELGRTGIISVPRNDIELCWLEIKFMDPKEHRPAFGRHAVARGFDVAVLLTFSYWEDDMEKFMPVWEELLRSVELGRYVDDPTKGDILH